MSQKPNLSNRSSEAAGLGVGLLRSKRPGGGGCGWYWVFTQHDPLPEEHPLASPQGLRGVSQGHGGRTEIRARPGGCDSVWLPGVAHPSSAPAGPPPSLCPPEAICCSPGFLGWFPLRADICLQPSHPLQAVTQVPLPSSAHHHPMSVFLATFFPSRV